MTEHILPGSIEPEIVERLFSRRSAILKGASTSAAVAAGLRMASVPFALAALSRDVFAQGLPSAVVKVLNFALTLEYLESEFYDMGVAASGLIPAQDRAIFTTIQGHEQAHVQYLRNALGGAAIPKPTFDFTAGGGSGTGPFAGVFSNYEIFKALSQAFEDTGVRAYKGQAAALQPYPAILTAALTVHSVEARHASEVRRLRGNFSETTPNKGWITRDLTDIVGTEPIYDGEENARILKIDLTMLNGAGLDEATEAFDEPLSMQEVLAIVGPFIV